MLWLSLAALVLFLAFWLPSLRRRVLLENALRFGRDFYGIDLSSIVGTGSQRQFCLKHIQMRGEQTPQAVFFMLVPAVLGILDDFQRLRLREGLLEMRLCNAVHQSTFEEFEAEYNAVNKSGYNWAEAALKIR